MKEMVALDLEVYPNYFLIGLKKLADGKKLQIEVKGVNSSLTKDQIRIVKTAMTNYTTFGFNSNRYDMPVLCKMLDGATSRTIFEMSKDIVANNLQTWQSYSKFDVVTDPVKFDHIDISEPSPAVFVSLKAYGARLHSKKLQDLPYPFDKTLTESEMAEVMLYNENDLDTTIDLYQKIKDRIDLRVEMTKQYGQDVRSKSDAQIAEAVIIKELTRQGVQVTKAQIPKQVQYKAPPCVSFTTPVLKNLLARIQAEPFKINPKNGSPVLPDWLKKFPLSMGSTKYQIGIGGLHSKEKGMVVIPTEDEVLRNIDVTSYYPSMIIEYSFYPKRLTTRFLNVYRAIYNTRLRAKAEKNMTVSDGLKIVLNGSFGKLGSMYSKLYAPDLMLQVTITGQLMLLMLIEQLEHEGISVKSSNTDGVEILCPKAKEEILEAIVFDWELKTGMNMEHGQYKALYARDVNNYVAVYDGYTKAKGVYTEPTLSKNSEYPIVFTAIKKFLLDSTPMKTTIEGCNDIRQFLTARTVKGGAVWNGQYLGKVVRWYYCKEGTSIHYATNGNKVPKSDGACPMMDLDSCKYHSIQDILDYDKYLELAIGHLEDLGVLYDKQ